MKKKQTPFSAQRSFFCLFVFFHSFILLLELHLLLHFGQIHTLYLIKFRVKFTRCQAHLIFGMKRSLDNIQRVSVWNDLRMKMTQNDFFDISTNEAFYNHL